MRSLSTLLLTACVPSTVEGRLEIAGETASIVDCMYTNDILTLWVDDGAYLLLVDGGEYISADTECTEGVLWEVQCTPPPVELDGCFTVDAGWTRHLGFEQETYDGTVTFACDATAPTILGAVDFVDCPDTR